MIGQDLIFTNEIVTSCPFHYSILMIEFILASVLSNAQAHALQNQEQVNRVCAYIVGIPYASDNFSDAEWERFKLCRELISEENPNEII